MQRGVGQIPEKETPSPSPPLRTPCGYPAAYLTLARAAGAVGHDGWNDQLQKDGRRSRDNHPAGWRSSRERGSLYVPPQHDYCGLGEGECAAWCVCCVLCLAVLGHRIALGARSKGVAALPLICALRKWRCGSTTIDNAQRVVCAPRAYGLCHSVLTCAAKFGIPPTPFLFPPSLLPPFCHPLLSTHPSK